MGAGEVRNSTNSGFVFFLGGREEKYASPLAVSDLRQREDVGALIPKREHQFCGSGVLSFTWYLRNIHLMTVLNHSNVCWELFRISALPALRCLLLSPQLRLKSLVGPLKRPGVTVFKSLGSLGLQVLNLVERSITRDKPGAVGGAPLSTPKSRGQPNKDIWMHTPSDVHSGE